MRLKILVLTFYFLSGGMMTGQTAATITDVDFKLENNLIVINYSITGALNNGIFEIGLYFVTESGQYIVPVSVSGDIGKNIMAGSVKTIYWDIDNDRLEVSGVLKAVVTIISSQAPVIEPFGGVTQVRGEKPLGGPGYAFLSFVVPSLGGYFVERKKTRPIIFSVTEATLAVHLLNLNGKIKQYEADLDNPSISMTEYNKISEELTAAEDNYYRSMATFSLIWVTDIIWVLIKGSQNMKQGKTKGTQSNYYSDGINLNYSGNQFCIGYRITF